MIKFEKKDLGLRKQKGETGIVKVWKLRGGEFRAETQITVEEELLGGAGSYETRDGFPWAWDPVFLREC